MQQIKEIRNTPVAKIMTTNVVTIDGSQKVSEAVMLMRKHKISSVVVRPRNEDDTWGIVTESDILAKVVDPGHQTSMDIWNTLVHQIMTKPVISTYPEMRVKYAIRLMHKVKVRRLLVMDGNQLKGILTESNILNAVEDLPVNTETAL